MAQNSEKRFHSIMDKLFHAPKTTPTSSRGKKRPNPSSALALVEPRMRIEGSQHSSASAGTSQAPMCRPWDRGDLMRRLATFKSMTWFAKPKVVSAVNCARRGWVNVDMDIIGCESCGARLFFSTSPSWSQEQVEKAALVFSLKLDNGHKLLCPWIDNACDERLAEFPPMTPEDLVDKFKERSSGLIQLLALPVISSSALEYMRSPQLEEFLRQPLLLKYNNGSTESFQSEANDNGYGSGADPANFYHQAQKLISLCGWEPRSLPYVVDCKEGANQFVKDTDILNSSEGVYRGQNPSPCFNSAGSNETLEETVNSEDCRLQNDPNSVVLDCRLCGASVGLWAFKAVPRPVELFRLVGYVEINPRKNAPGHEHNVDDGSIVNTGSNIGSSSKEQFSNLRLTIAGGPPPAKQSFKATISLPVIGRNLRARFSLDSEFRDWINSREETQSEPRSNSLLGDKDSSISGHVVTSEDSGPLERNTDDKGFNDSRSNDQPPCLDLAVSGRCDTLGNHHNRTSEGTSIVASSDSSKYNSIMEVSPENIQNVAQVTDENDSLPGHAENEQTTQMDKACGKEVSLAKHRNSSSVASYLENNANADVTHNMVTEKETAGSILQKGNNQEGDIVGDQSAANNKVMAYGAGKELKQLSLDKNMEFDPIRQHRHFCPWIVSIGSSSPGWKQTLSALSRQKDISHYLPICSPPSSSLIKVDDPIESVRMLFTSPVAKRLKLTRESN